MVHVEIKATGGPETDRGVGAGAAYEDEAGDVGRRMNQISWVPANSGEGRFVPKPFQAYRWHSTAYALRVSRGLAPEIFRDKDDTVLRRGDGKVGVARGVVITQFRRARDSLRTEDLRVSQYRRFP